MLLDEVGYVVNSTPFRVDERQNYHDRQLKAGFGERGWDKAFANTLCEIGRQRALEARKEISLWTNTP